MLDAGSRTIAAAQAERLRLLRSAPRSALLDRLSAAREPSAVRQEILRERPIVEASRSMRGLGPDPADLRDEAAAAGVLDATPHDLAFRRLHPGLDLGVYCANHAMGKPSVASQIAIEEHDGRLSLYGINAWTDGGWMGVIDEFRRAIAELCGADLMRGDVMWWPNLSESLSSVLSGLSGRMVTDESHFTTARYIHRTWGERTGSEIVELPPDASGYTPTERIADALTPDTAVVSLSHAAWRNGGLLDLDALADAMADRCPDAALILDVYQTAGTVPISVDRLPLRTAILGGGVKQLRAGTGAGYGWIGHTLLRELKPDRTGWWAHADPMAFADRFAPGSGGVRLRAGTPDLRPMVSLLAELRVLASSGEGSLRAAVARAREGTRRQTAAAARAAEEAGFEILGPRQPARRAAFFAVRVPDGPTLLRELAEDGIVADFRADHPGASSGGIRLSASSASFGYELLYAVDRIVERSGRR